MNPINQPTPQARLEFETKEIAPVFTYFLVFSLLLVFFFARSDGAPAHEIHWLATNGWTNERFLDALHTAQFAKIGMMAALSSFASRDMIMMGFNCYFFWVFARHLEQKIGTIRFMIILMVAIFVPWIVLGYVVKDTTTVFFSPALTLSVIIGAYMVFPPIPKSKLGQGTHRDRSQIFQKEVQKDPIERYTRNPWMFVGTFLVIQTLLHFWLTMGYAIFKPELGFDNVSLIPMVVGAAIGFGLCELMARSATSNIKESGQLTIDALRKYNQLIDLDVAHEDALKGTARHLGLPYDKVKEWVAKNKGKLRVK